MKLYFAEAYTLKENNWAAEIIGYSAEQLPNNEPPGSCPKNRQDCLKEKGPTEDGSLTGTRPTQTEAREDSPSGGERYRAGPVSLVRRSGHTRIQGFPVLRLHRQPTSGGIPRTAAGLAPASESCLRRTAPGQSPSRKSIPPSTVEAISGSCGAQKKVRPYDLTLKRRLPTLPRENRSTIGVSELNFSVRNGKRWNLTAITT